MRLRSVVVAIVLLLVAACGESSQSASSSQTITIGAIYPLSGPQAPGGKDELGGVQAALQVAQAQGVLDRRVQLRIIDAITPAQASAAVDQLVQQDHVAAILGTYGSTLSAAASARAEKLKTVYWETGAVADPITAQRRYVFRTVATGSSLGRMAVTFTHDVLIPASGLPSPRVVIVHVNDIYGESVGGGEAHARAAARHQRCGHDRLQPERLRSLCAGRSRRRRQAGLSVGRELPRRRSRDLASHPEPARSHQGGGGDELSVLHAGVRSQARR